MYLLKKEKRCNTLRDQQIIIWDIIEVLNELPTDKRHNKVPQYILLCHTHVDKKHKQVFEKFLVKCVKQPDPSGVPLMYCQSKLKTFVNIIKYIKHKQLLTKHKQLYTLYITCVSITVGKELLLLFRWKNLFSNENFNIYHKNITKL